MSALVDFCVNSEPFVDPLRVKYLKEKLQIDFGLSLEEVEKNIKRLRTGLRPMSPDEFPIIGPLSHYPNVFLNVAYGPQGFQSLCGSKILESIIENTDEKE